MRLIPVSTLVSSRILRSIAKISAKFGGKTLLTPYSYVRVALLRTYTLCIGIKWFRICPSRDDIGVSTEILGLVSCWSRSRPRPTNFPGEVATPTADMLVAKILFNNVVCTKDAKLTTMDISNFCLNTPMDFRVHPHETHGHPYENHRRIQTERPRRTGW